MLFIDIFLANLCLMSRITIVEARPMPQYLHAFHPANHPATTTTKVEHTPEDPHDCPISEYDPVVCPPL